MSAQVNDKCYCDPRCALKLRGGCVKFERELRRWWRPLGHAYMLDRNEKPGALELALSRSPIWGCGHGCPRACSP